MIDGSFRSVESAPVAEGIGRDVHDPHNERADAEGEGAGAETPF